MVRIFRRDVDRVLAAACLLTFNVGVRNGDSTAAVASSEFCVTSLTRLLRGERQRAKTSSKTL